MSRETLNKITNNPEVIEQDQENPPVKNLPVCPSNDLEDLERPQEEDSTMDTTPEVGDTASRKQSLAGSDDNSYYDTHENPTGSPTVDKPENSVYKTTESLIKELEKSDESINTSNDSQESMDTGLENTIIENKGTGEGDFNSEYMNPRRKYNSKHYNYLLMW